MCRNGDVAKRQKVGRQKLGLDVSTLVYIEFPLDAREVSYMYIATYIV